MRAQPPAGRKQQSAGRYVLAAPADVPALRNVRQSEHLLSVPFDHFGGQHARHAAQQNAAAAEHLLQVLRAFLDGHATRDLAHRRQ